MKVNAGQASSTLIPEYIGSDFDKVITVADNIETVTEVVDNLNHIKTVEGNLGIINTVSSNIDKIAVTSSNIEDVKSVVTNIDHIKVVESNLENIVTVVDNVTDVGNVSANIGYVKNVAEGIEGLPVISYIGDKPPTQPLNGAEWYCTADGRSYVWYVDTDSSQWVESSPQSDSVKGQQYFGNWNPNEQQYPVTDYYNGLWDVVLNPGQSSVQFDNKTWVSGNKLSYYADTGIYTQIQTFSEVYSVNGKKGAVVLSAADIGADASGAAASAVTGHEAKAGAHGISGVSGLQSALDGKVPVDRTVNGKALTSDVIIGSGDIPGLVGSISAGAIIERGANANGEYVKFADGTMICTAVFQAVTAAGGTTSQGIYYAASLGSHAFPAAFIAVPKIDINFTPVGGVGTFWASFPSVATKLDWPSAYPFSEMPITIGSTIIIGESAIGRWK